MRQQIHLQAVSGREEQAATLKRFSDSFGQRMLEVRATLETKIRELQTDNGARLEEMRKTVDEAYAGEQLVTVRRRAVERRVRDVQGALARASAQGDPVQLAAVQNELWVLQQYDQALREKGPAAL